MPSNLTLVKVLVIVAGFGLLVFTSGVVVNGALGRISSATLRRLSPQVRDTGFVVGKCENILIMTFMLLSACTALGLIFAAKGLVRREAENHHAPGDDSTGNETYYVAGTLVNLTWSIIIGVVVKVLLKHI
jgi:hypothetical protein